MLLASNLINVENVYLNFVSIRILLPSGSRATIFLFFFPYLLTRTLLRLFLAFFKSFLSNTTKIILITLLRDDLDESCLFDSSFFSPRNKKIFADISHSSLQLSQKSRCYWCLCTVLSVDYANMPRLLTKLSLFFANFSSFWLEAFVTETREEISFKKCLTRQ